MTRLLVLLMAAIVLLSAGLSKLVPDASASTIKHRSWKGYTSCHGHKWKKAHPHRKRCHRVKSRELRKREGAIRYARTKLGNWYQWGGTGPYGFDCSGIIYAAYRHVGVHIPRTTYAQLGGLRYHGGRKRKGDLVFPHRGHVGMYIGHGRVLEAAHTGTRLRIVGMGRFHWAVRSPRL